MKSFARRHRRDHDRDVTATLRRARPEDVDAVEDYHHRCFVATYRRQIDAGEFGPPDRSGTREQLRRWFQLGSAFETWVAVHDGSPVGHVTVFEHHLVHLFVDPDHQARGLGRRLHAHGERMLATAGHTALELKARVENVDAITFYEHAGWAVTDRVVRTVEHGITYDERILVKDCSLAFGDVTRDPTSS